MEQIVINIPNWFLHLLVIIIALKLADLTLSIWKHYLEKKLKKEQEKHKKLVNEQGSIELKNLSCVKVIDYDDCVLHNDFEHTDIVNISFKDKTLIIKISRDETT